jgi:hypothetical protein
MILAMNARGNDPHNDLLQAVHNLGEAEKAMAALPATSLDRLLARQRVERLKVDIRRLTELAARSGAVTSYATNTVKVTPADPVAAFDE